MRSFLRSAFAAVCFLSLPLSLHCQDDHDAALPVTRVSLYKNGVGFFEHTGTVRDNAAVTINFTSAQLNDVLQSLTAIDLNGGRISGAGYNSNTPLEQQLKTLPLALSANPTAADFYAAIRGARIEVRSGQVSVTGRLLSIEISPPGENPSSNTSDYSTAHPYLTLVSDTGDVRTVEVTQTTTIHLQDAGLNSDVTRYLKLLDSTRSQGLRHLTLEDHGNGARELRVSYISEVPIWKSTYRILLTEDAKSSAVQTATLQGWSVVDNTTGTDWINVHLSLIAGAPQSFIQPLSQPIYSHRPEIGIAQEAQIQPQTFESGISTGVSGLRGTITDPSGAVIPRATIVATNTTNGAQQRQTAGQSGQFSIALQPGRYKVEVSAPGFQTLLENNIEVGHQTSYLKLRLSVGAADQTVEVTAAPPSLETSDASVGSIASSLPAHARASMSYTPGVAAPPPATYEEAASGSFQANTQSNAFDDFFAYNLTEPVTIHKNESALVPILQGKLNAERVTLVHSNGDAIAAPLRALWITNTTGLTLDRGSFSIVENGNFGGEGLLDPIHNGEKRLLSYAADQAIHVSIENIANNQKIVRITAAKGVLIIHHAEHTELTYVIHNAAAAPRTIILEHPVQSGYTLDGDAKPEETTDSIYRFRVNAAAGETAHLHVSAHHAGLTTYQLDSADEKHFAFFLQESNNDPKLAAAIAPILEAQRRSTEADNAVEQTKAKLTNLQSTEQRERANIAALQAADKESRERFVRDLNHTEDEITATEKELEARETAQDQAQDAVDKLIENLQFDEPI